MSSRSPRSATLHPDYEAAAAERRWMSGKLSTLYRVLLTEVSESSAQRSWKVLPKGAYVRLWREDGRLHVRIARRQAPRTATGPAAFQREVDTFVRGFGIAAWERSDEPDAPGISVILKEPAR